ncbi:MAG: septum formation inhibitor Maf [Betaproteobacteria bacterium]|nr:septum formation inhibitor Maf [Betaproteobacteria bacterium]MDE2056245.1 septum formation inhibitor Maf [Betaproteobacteria bacterium]
MIYLASNSPRRRELLSQIDVEYELFLPDNQLEVIDETPLHNEAAIDYVTRVARAKATVSWERLIQSNKPLYPLLAADTTVTINNFILGKPQSEKEAKQFLELLSGQKHTVLTAVVCCFKNQLLEKLSMSHVFFKSLTQQDIEWYIESGEYKDKAGGYALQGLAASFVTHIEGSPSGIIGLPLYETRELLNAF